MAPEYVSLQAEEQKALRYLLCGHPEEFQGTFADDLSGFPRLLLLNECMEQTLAKENPDGFPAL